MKIYLSKYWRQSSLCVLCLIIVLVVGLLLFRIWSNSEEDYIMVICVTWFVLVLGCILFCSKRFLTYAIIEKHQIHAYSFFSKELCTIRTTDPIYYALFTTPQGVKSQSEFIALSNEPFEYQATYGIAKVRFIQHYNLAKQIVLPYNDQVAPLLNLENWHKMN